MFEPVTITVGTAAIIGASAGSALTGLIWYIFSTSKKKRLERKYYSLSELASESLDHAEHPLTNSSSDEGEKTTLKENRLKNRTKLKANSYAAPKVNNRTPTQIYEAILSFTLLHKGLYFELVNSWEKVGKLYIQLADEQEICFEPFEYLEGLLDDICLCIDLLILLLEAEKTEVYPVVLKLEYRKRPCWRKVIGRPLVDLAPILLEEVESATECVYAAVSDLRKTIGVAREMVTKSRKGHSSSPNDLDSFISGDNSTCQTTLLLRLLDLRLLVLTSKVTEQFLTTEVTYYRFLGKYSSQDFLGVLEGRLLSQLSRIPRGPGRILSWALTTATPEERVIYFKLQHSRLAETEFLALVDLLAAELSKPIWEQTDSALQEANIWSTQQEEPTNS
eukprot:jgi/Galph1/708/GphlegSOOS_G5530.1